MIWDCDTATGLWRCGSGSFFCPDMVCDGNDDVISGFAYQDQATNEYGGGVCQYPHPEDTQTLNYMEIDYYTSFYDSPDGCPAVVRQDGSNEGFEYQATDTFATNICVKQDDGTYIMSVLQ